MEETLRLINDNLLNNLKVNFGANLIALERKDHFIKHNRSIQDDIKFNTNDQLVDAAIRLLDLDPDVGSLDSKPFKWNPKIWDKMYNKPYLQRLVIAGSLIAAQIDKIIYTTNFNKTE